MDLKEKKKNTEKRLNNWFFFYLDARSNMHADKY